VDLDLVLVRSFAAVAEHRHFGRAAQALHTTQPSLSRQIGRLEQQVGARLIDRTPSGSQLTEAGEAFLPLATDLLRSAATAVARARAAAHPSRITVGYTAGIIVTPAVRELRHRHPAAEAHTIRLACDDPREALLEYRADAVVTRLPLPPGALRLTALYDEPRVLVIPVDHRLAGKESISLDDIAGEPLPEIPRTDPDKFEHIAEGDIVIVSAGLSPDGGRPDLTTVPIDDVEPSHVVLATRADDRNRLVSAFREYAQTCLTGTPAWKRGHQLQGAPPPGEDGRAGDATGRSVKKGL
jgi:DNA-binding transcriptional LysR family regulator